MQDGAGNVKKGSLDISGNYKIVDDLKEDAEYEFTIFYGDTRVTKSLKDHKTGERLVGTKAGEQVIKTVLENGEEYSDTTVVMGVIENLSAISEENAASAQETNASMEELNANLTLLSDAAKDLLDLSTELEKSMEFFTVE